MARADPNLEALEIDRFQRWDWRAVRAAKWVFLAVLALAALGLFGGGPLSVATTGDDKVSVEYERFARVGRTSRLTLRLDRAEQAETTLEIERYLDGLHIERVAPEAKAEIASGGARRFRFETEPGRPAVFEFYFRHEKSGARSGHARLAGERHAFSSFVYP